jgi:hypothetical protein
LYATVFLRSVTVQVVVGHWVVFVSSVGADRRHDVPVTGSPPLSSTEVHVAVTWLSPTETLRGVPGAAGTATDVDHDAPVDVAVRVAGRVAHGVANGHRPRELGSGVSVTAVGG